jgi:hypothetical protein
MRCWCGLGVVSELSPAGATDWLAASPQHCRPPTPNQARPRSRSLLVAGRDRSDSERRPGLQLGQRVAGEPPSPHRLQPSRIRRLRPVPAEPADERRALPAVKSGVPCAQFVLSAARRADDQHGRLDRHLRRRSLRSSSARGFVPAWHPGTPGATAGRPRSRCRSSPTGTFQRGAVTSLPSLTVRSSSARRTLACVRSSCAQSRR